MKLSQKGPWILWYVRKKIGGKELSRIWILWPGHYLRGCHVRSDFGSQSKSKTFRQQLRVCSAKLINHRWKEDEDKWCTNIIYPVVTPLYSQVEQPSRVFEPASQCLNDVRSLQQAYARWKGKLPNVILKPVSWITGGLIPSRYRVRK